MKVRTKLVFFLFLVILAFIMGFLIQRTIEQKRLAVLFEERKNEQEAVFDKIIEVRGSALRNLVYDYTYWDEMVNAITKEDKAWFSQMVDTSVLTNYDTTAVWIYKNDLSLAYSINNLEDAKLKDIPLPKENIKNLFFRGPFCHFFLDTSRGLMEIRGATVHPTADLERKTLPQGYFFSGHLWGKDYIAELSLLTESTIVIMRPSVKEKFFSDIKQGTVAFFRILSGPDKQPLVRLEVMIKSKAIAYLNKTYRQQFFLLLIFSGGILIFTAFSLGNIVIIPLQLISQALSTENITFIEKLEKGKDEFSGIAALIGRFFEQKMSLVNEIVQCKQTEEKLKDAYNKLKQTEAQLIQSAKMASLGQLASGVAHEINNPLTGVLNNIQLIKMEIKQKRDLNLESFRDILDAVESSASRCKKIIRSLLDFSHPSKGAFKLLFINEIIEKAISVIEQEMNLKNIFVQKELSPDLPAILGDTQLLNQVIFDIIANAQWAIEEKPTKEGGVITIKTQYAPEKNGIHISISDTGIGIPQENLDKIFEPFFTTKPVGQGTGLGLSIVHSILAQHNATIEVESQVDKGTTFRIFLPGILEKAYQRRADAE